MCMLGVWAGVGGGVGRWGGGGGGDAVCSLSPHKSFAFMCSLFPKPTF